MKKLMIGGRAFTQFRVSGEEVRPIVDRVLAERGSRRVYLQKEGGCVLREVNVGADIDSAACPGDSYVLVVEGTLGARATS